MEVFVRSILLWLLVQHSKPRDECLLSSQQTTQMRNMSRMKKSRSRTLLSVSYLVSRLIEPYNAA